MNRNLKIATIALIAAMLVAPILFQAHASSAPLYDLTGTWTWHYTYPQEDSPITENHTMVINYFNTTTGEFSGFGFNKDSPAYNWTVEGYEYVPESESGISVEFTITYDLNSPIPYSYIYATGSLSSPTFMNGTATMLTGPTSETDSASYEEMPASWNATKMSPDPNVTLSFPPGTSIRSVSITEYNSTNSPYPPLRGEIGPIYNITVVFGTSAVSLTSCTLAGCSFTSCFAGMGARFTVGIHYNPNLVSNPSKLVIAQFDFPLSDLNCAQNLGKIAKWINKPTTVDTINDFVYCTTDHLSGFGIHM